MFNLNGSKNYSEIDRYTNSFSIYHSYGKVFSSSNTITVKRGDTSFHVRPASIIFKNNEVKISFGSYIFNDSDIIFYSFMFYKFEQAPRVSESDIQARLTIISISQINGSIRIIGICPNSVYVDADIPFDSIQSNKNPIFNIHEPEDNGIDVVGYYYAINQTKNYFITRNDKFVSSFAINESNSQSLFPGNFTFSQSQDINSFINNNPSDDTYIRLSTVMVNESFPKSGTWYFHVKAINSITNMSRMTATYTCIYNSPPSVPGDLRTNTDVFYEGALSHHSMSFIQSESDDDDEIQYNYELYKNDELIKQGTFYSTKYDDRLATIEANLTIVRNNFYAKMTIDGRGDTDYSSSIIASLETYVYSEEYSYDDIPCLNCKLEIYKENEESNSESIENFNKHDERLIYFYDNINEIGYGDGIFKWRVRALDWLQQSPFSDFCNYTVSTIKEMLVAKLTIPIYGIEQGFKGKLNILSNSIIKGILYIYPILNAKLYIAKHSDQETYPEPGSLDYRVICKMFIRPYSELYCKMRVVNNFSTFSGKLILTDVKGSEGLKSRLIVIKPGDDGLKSKLTISLLSGSSFTSKMLMCLKSISDIKGKIEIQNVGFSCKTIILRNTSIRDEFNNNQFDSYYLSGRMTCVNKPNRPIITSNVGNDWQSNNNISISWFSPPANIPVVSYGYLISNVRLSSFNIGNFLNTTLLSSDFNMNNYGGVGEYYFYIFARASNGSISEVSEYRIRYNIKPQAPGSIMLINGNECIINRPLISLKVENTFTWNRVFTQDGDLLYYDFEISDNIGFGNIVYSSYNILNNANTETLGIQVLHSYDYKTYYWRVRSFDGKEYSNWSLTGQFAVNTPPSPPTNLRIE